MSIVGIDLGTTNSLISVWRDGKCELIPNSVGEYLTPSVVSIGKDGTVYVGKIANEKLISEPQNTVASFKRMMGTKKQYKLGGKYFYAQELSSFVLRKLKEDAQEYLGEVITEAIISVPAYFNDKQRYATKLAGQLAGFKVERLVNEPSAAALACSMERKKEEGCILVFDFGGGTLDVSIVEYFENVIEIIAVSGDNHLGGNDFDLAIAKYFCEEHRLNYEDIKPAKKASLLKEAEKCKFQLSTNELVVIKMEVEGEIYAVFVDNNKLIKIGSDIFRRIAKIIDRAFQDSKKTMEDIDDIIMVGGSCKMPVIKQYLRQLLKKKPVEVGSADEIVARGVGIYAGIKERKEDIKDMLLMDICPFSLGIATYNEECVLRHLMSPIIERNSTLPSSKVERFATVSDNQSRLIFQIYQGENMYCDQNLKLGELEMKIPLAPAGKQNADVRFSYDLNGILEVEIFNPSAQNVLRTVLFSKEIELSEEEIEEKLRQLEQLKIHPRDMEENQMLISRGERLFTENVGFLRNFIKEQMQQFQKALHSQDEREIRKRKVSINSFFDQIDNTDIEEQDAYFENWLMQKDEED